MTLELTKEISPREGNQSDHVRKTFNPSAQVYSTVQSPDLLSAVTTQYVPDLKDNV